MNDFLDRVAAACRQRRLQGGGGVIAAGCETGQSEPQCGSMCKSDEFHVCAFVCSLQI